MTLGCGSYFFAPIIEKQVKLKIKSFSMLYFVRKTDEAATEYGVIAPNGLTLITESGYLIKMKIISKSNPTKFVELV